MLIFAVSKSVFNEIPSATQCLNESFIRTHIKQQRMIPNRYFIPILFFSLLAATQNATAQCTTNAGSLAFNIVFSCEGQGFSVNYNNNQVLDGDDILLFVAYTGSTPNAGTVFATSTTETFAWQADFLTNSPFKVAAVAGNNAGGTVDWSDPCLSVSTPATVTYLTAPDLVVTPGPTLTCVNTTSTLTASANQQNLSYAWSNGVTTPTVIVAVPGVYTVTVTNQGGCTATAGGTVTQDIAVPTANAGGGGIITCSNPVVTLNANSSTQGVVFTWIGPNGFNSNQQNPTVSVQGTYTLVVTGPNGCTSTDVAVVTADVISPTANAGQDQGLPCGGGSVILNAASAPGVTYQWSGPGPFMSVLQNPEVTQPGNYTLIVTSQNGCTSTDQVTVYPGPLISMQDFAITSVMCFGDDNGAISLTTLPAAGQPPFDFSWTGPNNFSSNQQNISGLPAGVYTLIATDATGCSYYSPPIIIIQPAPLIGTFGSLLPPCPGSNTGTATVSISGGTPPYLITWSNNATGPVVHDLPAGTYTVTITDALGCTTVTQPLVLTDQPPILISSLVTNSNCSNNGSIAVTPIVPNQLLDFAWTGPGGFASNLPIITNLVAGPYDLLITDLLNGCTATYSFQIQNLSDACGYLSGRVARDTSDDCVADSGEPGLDGWIVLAENGTDTYYGTTNVNGQYLVGVPLGTYTVTAVLPNDLWELCPQGAPVTLDMVDDTIPGGDIPVKKLQNCPALSVNIGTNVLRRCFSNNYYYIDYCNDGTTTAENAYILVTLDPFMTPLSASAPFTNLGNNVLRFNLGNVAVGDCGTISLRVSISCSAVLGQTHCTEAHIYPDSSCTPPNPQWSGASVQVTSQCSTDSVYFFIQNTGLGNMTGSVNYIVVEDAVMLMTGQVQLDAGQQITLAFPANGSTWYVAVDQVPFYPGNSQPSLAVEGCTPNTSFSTGFFAMFPVNDADPWVDIDCTANIGSYDPNDKQGFPLGYGASHYIRPGTPIEYMIRFQNTGTDTAFNVRVVDTLSTWLDPATIQPGPSSHPYQFNLSGHGIASFLFDNILLPDSNVNQVASNGFVKFSILPRADAPLETVIENNAAIYFDFNDPVITNTVFHRLGEDFLVGTWQPHLSGADVKVTPNPFTDEATLEVTGLHGNDPLHLQVFNLQGLAIKEMETSGAVFRLRKEDWPAGIYLFSISQGGRLVGSGKLMAH